MDQAGGMNEVRMAALDDFKAQLEKRQTQSTSGYHYSLPRVRLTSWFNGDSVRTTRKFIMSKSTTQDANCEKFADEKSGKSTRG
jgi:hypothetical protein